MAELIALLIVIVPVVIIVRRRKRKKRLEEMQALLMQQQARATEQVNTESAPLAYDVTNGFTVRMSIDLGSAGRGSETSVVDEVLESQTCWVPPGRPIEVAGYSIPDGMIYVGEMLHAKTGWDMDAALIVPSLPVDREQIDRTGTSMSYWPSYSEIGRGNRAAYLEWLATGRRDPSAYIGYVFLFLYGLERRLLFDIKEIPVVKDELTSLIGEVSRLRELYGARSGSFDTYARELIQAVTLSTDINAYLSFPIPTTRVGWDYPLQLKIAIASVVQNGDSIPPELALAWVRFNPEAQFRTPAVRCAAEFDSMFKVRYMETFPGGLKLEPNGAKLSASYKPASPSLPQVSIAIPNLPAVTNLKGPINKLMKLVDPIQDELESFSRQLGQGRERDSIAALATLPLEIQPSELSGEAKSVVGVIEAALSNVGMAVIESSTVTSTYPAKNPGKLSKTEATLLLQFLEKRGYGVEPDIRFGGANLSTTEHCAVYRLDGESELPGSSYLAATVLIHLAVAMAQADGDVAADEQRKLEQHMEQALHLNKSDQLRLAAHLQWLLSDPPKLTGAKSRILDLDENQRHSLGQFLISIAAADGHISPNEIKLLSKIYPLLGLDPDAVYSDVHALTAGDQGPVTVLRADGKSKTFAIPQQEKEAAGKQDDAISLDTARINAIREQSMEAAALLSSVFVEASGDSSADEVAEEQDAIDESATAGQLIGLDAKHSAMLRILVEQDRWSRADLEMLAQRHELMPSGAIETINEVSFDICGEPLLEGDDPIEINQYAKTEVLR